MKKTQIISLILMVALLFSFTVTGKAEEVSPAVTSGSHSLKAAVPLAGTDKLLDTAKAVIAYELNTDTLLYASLLNELRREAVTKLDFERSKLKIIPSEAVFESETFKVATNTNFLFYIFM